MRDVLVNEIAARGLTGTTLSVLDAGCGDGRLLRYLGKSIDARLCGFDSAEYGLQTAESIGSEVPDADIRQTLPDGSWPFEAESADIVISHQVLEHVFNFEQFCAENYRVLKPGGFAVHVFPTRHSFMEWHMNLPVVHKIRSHDVRSAAIRLLTSAGLGTDRNLSDRFAAAAHADYLRTFTTYRTWRELVTELHKQGFRATYRHSNRLPKLMAYSLLRMQNTPHTSHPMVEAATFPIVRSLVSVTLVIEKAQDYRSDWKAH